jgi:hypothetical protein
MKYIVVSLVDAEPMKKSEAHLKIKGEPLPSTIKDEDGFIVSTSKINYVWYNKLSFLNKALPIKNVDKISDEDIENSNLLNNTDFNLDHSKIKILLNVLLKWATSSNFINKK